MCSNPQHLASGRQVCKSALQPMQQIYVYVHICKYGRLQKLIGETQYPKTRHRCGGRGVCRGIGAGGVASVGGGGRGWWLQFAFLLSEYKYPAAQLVSEIPAPRTKRERQLWIITKLLKHTASHSHLTSRCKICKRGASVRHRFQVFFEWPPL